MSESAALFVGDLVARTILKTGPSCAPILPELLQITLKRLSTAKTSTFIHSLVTVFAQLMHHQLENVVVFLHTQVKIDGKSGLEILLGIWCQNAGDFAGDYPIKVW